MTTMMLPEHPTPVATLDAIDKPSLRKRLLRYVCVGGFVVSFLAASLVFGFALSYWSKRNNGPNTPTEEAIVQVFSPEEFKERYSIFRSETAKLSDALDLMQSNTPQSQALEWLVYEDVILSHDDNMDRTALAERYALMVVYFASDGLDSWLGRANMPTCDWDAVNCDLDGKALQLDLRESSLIGALPNELSLLSSLVSLDVSLNQLEGTIPSRVLAGLTNLESLNLSQNDFAGSVPSELGLLSRLTHLDVSQNLLNGELPTELQRLSNLRVVELSFTPLQGLLFEMFVRFWPNLESLKCRQTEMSGTVVDLPNTLQDLDMTSTKFTGTLTSLPYLPRLTHLRAAGNEFSGPLPNFVNLPNIETLSLETNAFTGTISSEIGLLSNLEHFQLIQSDVEGSIPSEIGFCTKLQTIHLTSNEISGTVPPELGNLPNLTKLGLNGRPSVQLVSCNPVSFDGAS